MDFYGILFDIKNGSKMPYSKNYFDTLFAQKLEELGVKTITGVLPLTFTTHTAGAADDWTICGNDDNGTENLFDKSTFVSGSFVTTTGTQSASNAAHSDYIPVEASQSYYLTDVVGIASFYSAVEYDNNKSAIGYLNISGSSKVSGVVTTSSNAAYVCINFKTANLDTIMVVKGSTAPDHYIPYQKGVGERTKQLIQSYRHGTLVNTARRDRACIVPLIDVVVGETLSFNTYDSNWKFAVYGVDEAHAETYKQTNVADSPQYDSGWKTGEFSYTVQSGIVGIVVMVSNSTNTNFNIADCNHIVAVKDLTAPDTFITFGYQIPLTISQKGQTDKIVDIYIGDSPLIEGETVSKQSTGVDIEMFEGENTVSTTLYNKPTMTITYK